MQVHGRMSLGRIVCSSGCRVFKTDLPLDCSSSSLIYIILSSLFYLRFMPCLRLSSGGKIARALPNGLGSSLRVDQGALTRLMSISIEGQVRRPWRRRRSRRWPSRLASHDPLVTWLNGQVEVAREAQKQLLRAAVVALNKLRDLSMQAGQAFWA